METAAPERADPCQRAADPATLNLGATRVAEGPSGGGRGRVGDEQRRKTSGEEERLTCGPTHKGTTDYSR